MKLSEQLAVAIDLGTTTIAASLVEMGSGRRLAMTGGLNPQREWGADVISRLAAAQASSETLFAMQRAVNASLERFTLELLNSAGVAATALQTIAIAGNPTMEHLLLGLPVESLAAPPYRPLFSAGKMMNTTELGWGMSVEAYIFPLPGGFVGGDLVAFLYGVESAYSRSPVPPLARRSATARRSDPPACAPKRYSAQERSPLLDPRLLLDLGTNGEVALIAGGKIYATSAAAGPAFEGGNLTCGMAALPGAINGVAVDGDRLSITTLGGKTPVGICGSAVIAAIAGLLDAGVLDSSGRLLSPGEIPSNLANNLIEVAGAPAFLLYRDASRTVHLTQEDIRQVQLAKGAIRGGMEVLFERAGVHVDDVREVVLTGSFGAVLSPAHLKTIGIFPEHMVEITTFVCEGALAGVEQAVRQAAGIGAVEELATAVKVIPLSGTPRFEKHFLAHLNFTPSP